MTARSALARLQTDAGAKLLRFAGVSAFNVVFGQTLLYAAQTVFLWSGVASNIFSVSISAIPAYILSRYWVWQKRGKNHLMREVVPFWVLTFIGFVLSTGAVWFVETTWRPHPLVINLTSLGAFGIVWVVKFFVLDRYLFTHDSPPGVSQDPDTHPS